MRPGEEEFVFNIVWTGEVFTYLQYFVASQLAHSTAHFRFVANGCTPAQITLMEEFRHERPDRVLEVFVASEDMKAHGVALDAVRGQRDDGRFFCFIDPDILARGPFVASFAECLEMGCVGVTSGRGVWRDDDVVPPRAQGVAGEHFYAQDGFLFGSPHFAMYWRDALDDTLDRWGVGFGSVGPELSETAHDYLVNANRRFVLYDTGKLVNIFLQADAKRLCHFEHENLVHIGGLSHYLSPPAGSPAPNSDPNQKWPWPVNRLEVSRFTAAVLQSLSEGHSAPEVPPGTEASVAPRLEMVRGELITLMRTYGP